VLGDHALRPVLRHAPCEVEQDHRAIKRQVRPMMGFKSFWSAAVTLAGIEFMHIIRKGQLRAAGRLRPANQFYSLAS
jgi:putative transposase